MAKELLTQKQQNIVMISAYTATGDLENLETSIKKGLDDGMTVNEVKEILVQMYAYCGFPKSLNGLSTLLKVTKNGKYKEGKAGKPLPKNADKNAVGTKVQTDLVGAEVKGELFDFAPAIDDYLKEHLFGDIFSRGVLTEQEREIATIAALKAIGNVEPQLNAHVQIGQHNGLTVAQTDKIQEMATKQTPEFGLGSKNDAFAKYFIGQSYLNLLTKDQIGIFNVTFEPKCRNNWHIHHGGGQILIVTDGRGWYQEWGKDAQKLKKGDVVNIPADIKHWHGAAADSWFSHIAIEVPSQNGSTEWLEKVSDEQYYNLK
ncbi:carboxymuconolactone decarboxylase family protein [bacterium]|nr:carboxymuconolactone decarboxylase family protein [bacterium]